MKTASALECWKALVRKEGSASVLVSPEGREMSRKELDFQSGGLGTFFQEKGLLPGRLLVVHMKNGVGWMTAFLAGLHSGMVVVPLDGDYSADETCGIASGLHAQAVWDGATLQRPPGNPRRFSTPQMAVGKLTSGSTGKPKILFFSDAEMRADARQIVKAMTIRSEDLNLGVIPWGHSYGLGNIIYPLLLQGTRVTWTNSPFPGEILDVCFRTKATVFPAVPTLLRTLSGSADCRKKLASLRLVISAGDRLQPELARTFQGNCGITPHNFYGSTETGGICFDATGEAALTGRSVGLPIEGVRIIPRPGRRFLIQSDAVYRYGNHRAQKGLPAVHLAADYGYLDERGELVLEKRIKGFIKIGARRINLAEVEARLERLPEIGQAIAFGMELGGETVLAAAVEFPESRSAFISLCKDNLPHRLRPKLVRCFDRFPVNHRGKLNLSAIRSTFES